MDYSFGYKGQGNVDTLREIGKKYKFKVYVIQPVIINCEKRLGVLLLEYIKNGNIKEANIFLGRPYSICSKVIHGKGIGKDKLGYPTANILIKPFHLVPQEGVYATFVKNYNSTYKGATCISTSPTFGNHDVSIETFIIDFDGDIYDEFIEIQFIKNKRTN